MAHYYSYPGLFRRLIICIGNIILHVWFCFAGSEQPKRADINNAVGIAEEPIVYRKLTDAVNKKLKRDWDKVEAQSERAEPICIPAQFTSS